MIWPPSAVRLPGKRSSGNAPQRCRLGPEDYYSRQPNSKAAGNLLGRGGKENRRSGRVSEFCVTPPSGELARFVAVQHVCEFDSLLRESQSQEASPRIFIAGLSL